LGDARRAPDTGRGLFLGSRSRLREKNGRRGPAALDGARGRGDRPEQDYSMTLRSIHAAFSCADARVVNRSAVAASFASSATEIDSRAKRVTVS
jgi:hypothetical protein